MVRPTAALLFVLCVMLGALAPGRAAVAGADAHGAVPLADDGDPHDPILSLGARRQIPGRLSFGGTLEFARAPLYLFVQDGEGTHRTPLLGDFLAWNLGASYGVADRLAVAASLPVFFASGTDHGVDGPGLGDLHLAVPVGLVLPDRRGRGFGLTLAPVLRAPTGNEDRYYGDRGFGVGARMVLGFGAGPIRATAGVGLDGRTVGGDDAVRDAPFGTLDGALSWEAVDGVALHLEGRAHTPPHGSAAPVELLAGARGGLANGLWWSGGVSRGMTSGVTASGLRVFAGIGYTPPLPADVTGPDAAPALVFEVAERDGTPIAGAAVSVGGEEIGRTDAAGRLAVIDEVRWRAGVQVAAAGFVTADVARTDGESVPVVLDLTPVLVRFRVQDQEGSPVGAALAFDGPSGHPSTTVDALGAADVRLPVGDWVVDITAPGHGLQRRAIRIPRGSRPLEIDAILTRDSGGAAVLALVVTDPQDVPIDGVRVRLDGEPLGATSTGGTLEVHGLQPGRHSLEVVADAYQALEIQDMEVAEGRNEIAVALKRVPGSVKVIARGPDGPVADAVVRFDGPSRLPPQGLGDDGERIVQVRPGTWRVLVISPSYGMQMREVVIPPDRTALTVVEVVMQPNEGGAAELALTIIDTDGLPVDGAEVFLDGRLYGTSASGGSVTLTGLNAGPRSLEVRGARFRPLDALPVFLVEGLQEQVVTLEWKPGTVKVVARTADGEVDDALARFAPFATGTPADPAFVPPLPLGPHGEAYTTLLPGEYGILVSSAQHGLQQRHLVVPADSRSLLVIEVVFSGVAAGDANLLVQVQGPDGAPVTGAAVTVDGFPLGATSTAGDLPVTGIAAGLHQVRVTAPLYRPAEQSVTLSEGDRTLVVTLGWAPGAVKVTTRSAEGPVTDAVLRFAGPVVLPPVRVDGRGERLLALSPGSWQGLASSPTYGLQARAIEIGEHQDGLLAIEFVMSTVAAGRAELLVRVVDPDGRPVPGARIRLGDRRAETSVGGAALLADLEPGRVSFRVEAPDFDPATVDGLTLLEGSHERIVELDWVPTDVVVTVLDADGNPVQATVQAEGPADVAPRDTDARGRATLALRPGSWQVVATSEALGTQSQQIEVGGDEAADVVFRLEAARVDLTTRQVRIREKVHFDFDRATLRQESDDVLAEVAATILSRPSMVRVEVQGHTDNTGGAAYNLDLAQRRAQAVVEALIARGVAPERLVSRGYGLTRPLVPNDTEAGKAENRRVQFEILEWSGGADTP